MRPDDSRLLAREIAAMESRRSPRCDELIGAFHDLTGLYWAEHQAFVLVPLWNFLRGNTVSKRLHARVADHLQS
jgi:hypothetical protein